MSSKSRRDVLRWQPLQLLLPLLLIHLPPVIAVCGDAVADELTVETRVDKLSYSWFGTITVTALVTHNEIPVPDCDSVVVTSPVNPLVRAHLADDGIPPDPTAGDGSYAGFFRIGGTLGEARPVGSYTVQATAHRGGLTGNGSSPAFSLYTVRRWSGITTGSLPDPSDEYTDFVVTSNGPGAGWHHRIEDLGLVRSTQATSAHVCIPILPLTSTITDVSVLGNQVSGVATRDNVIEFDCDLSATQVARVSIEFDAPTDLAATFIDRYHTGDMGQRDFRNGYVVWNQYIHTGILGSDYSFPHGPGCIVDLQVTDLADGASHTVDCMERVAIHLDDTPFNDGSGTYPSNVKWMGDAVAWFEHADLDSMTFVFHSGGMYGLQDKVAVTKTVTFYSESRMFSHHYLVQNIDDTGHDFDFVWGREQWIYGSAPSSNRADGDRGLLPNDRGTYGGEHGFGPQEVDGNWFAAFDESSLYSIGVIVRDRSAAAMPTSAYFLCDPPLLSNGTAEYPIHPAGSCTDMPNLFFEKQFGVLTPGEVVSYDFYQWGGYGLDQSELTHLLWLDAVEVSGEPLAIAFAPIGDEIPVDTPIEVWFNNPMDRASTEAAFLVIPEIPGGGTWEWLDSDRHLRFQPAENLMPGTIYQVEVARSATDVGGVHLATEASWYFETATTTAVLAAETSPPVARLAGAAPNPFSSSTDISFVTPDAGPVRLLLYDARGRLVSIVHDGHLPAGQHVVVWRGDDTAGRPLVAGVYFCRLETAGRHEVAKIVIRR